MDKEKSEAAKQVFWRRATPVFFSVMIPGIILLAVLTNRGILPFKNNLLAQLVIWGALIVATFAGTRAVKRAGLSQYRVNTVVLSSPRPDVDLPPTEVRSNRESWGGIAIITGFVSLVIFALVFFFGGKNVGYGYGAAGFFGCIAIWTACLWKRNGYVLAKLDADTISIWEGVGTKQVLWSEVRHCKIIQTKDVFGNDVAPTVQFLREDYQKIAGISLGDAHRADRERFLEGLKARFAEETNASESRIETTKEEIAQPVKPTTLPEEKKVQLGQSLDRL